MKFSETRAIDAHGHYGTYPQSDELVNRFMTGSAEEVVERALACGVDTTIVSPLSGLMPRGHADAVAGNDEAFRVVPKTPGLLQYVIVNPLQPKTYDQAREMLQAPWCVGIKVHPEEHRYLIADRGEELFSFFESVNAPVMSHTGCPNSLPEAFVPFADRHPGAQVLLAHLGNGAGDKNKAHLQVRAVQAAKHRNLWVDSSSARSILPGLIEWAVKEIGAERILFGSDTPLYHVALQRARIEVAGLTPQQERLILRENARTFFRLDETLRAKAKKN